MPWDMDAVVKCPEGQAFVKNLLYLAMGLQVKSDIP